MRQAYDYWQDQPGSIPTRRRSSHAVTYWRPLGQQRAPDQRGERASFVETICKGNTFERLLKHIMPPNAPHPRERAPTTRPATSLGKAEAERDAGFGVRRAPNEGCRQKRTNETRRFHHVRYRCKNRSIAAARNTSGHVNEEELTPTVRCPSTEPTDPNYRITTHAPYAFEPGQRSTISTPTEKQGCRVVGRGRARNAVRGLSFPFPFSITLVLFPMVDPKHMPAHLHSIVGGHGGHASWAWGAPPTHAGRSPPHIVHFGQFLPKHACILHRLPRHKF